MIIEIGSLHNENILIVYVTKVWKSRIHSFERLVEVLFTVSNIGIWPSPFILWKNVLPYIEKLRKNMKVDSQYFPMQQ